MDYTLREWVEMAGKHPLSWAAVQAQMEESGDTEDEVRSRMQCMLRCMKEAVQDGMQQDLRSLSGLTGGQAFRLHQRYAQGKALCGSLLGKATVYALATAESNACMGKIVAAPTAGACGVLPGAVLACMEERQISEDLAVNALLTAAAVGVSIATEASIAGAEGGCQAECGAAAAMTAAALVEIEGGSAMECAEAAAFALMNLLGLVCDPVGGLVEVPCVYRNVGAVSVAFSAADMVLSGIRCPIEPDEVIQAMKEVGDVLPGSLRETGEGGCAACPSVCFRKQDA
ncbi:MAG: L-serine ammonia-lyase, iron-sulfur-dependent, subunit alpha [Clostridia bacterium]|nr:L-serine ammonia-lyase, iron-sulfur-dependent, subunit alpha [Clostridia bacterium]